MEQIGSPSRSVYVCIQHAHTTHTVNVIIKHLNKIKMEIWNSVCFQWRIMHTEKVSRFLSSNTWESRNKYIATCVLWRRMQSLLCYFYCSIFIHIWSQDNSFYLSLGLAFILWNEIIYFQVLLTQAISGLLIAFHTDGHCWYSGNTKCIVVVHLTKSHISSS